MRGLFIIIVFLCSWSWASGQSPETLIQKRFNDIKRIIQPDIVQLPDSVIVFPIIGLTNIRVMPPSMICGPYTEVELWIVDFKGQIIYNNITTTTPANANLTPFEREYRRYMKMQRSYLMQHASSLAYQDSIK